MRNHSTLPSCLYLQQQNFGFSQSSSLDPSISVEMNEDFGSRFSLQSEGLQSNQAQLNYSDSEFSYFTPADTIDAVITPTIYQIPFSKADKETHFGQPFQSDNSRVSRKRPLEELVLRDGISGLISNPDELKSFKSKANENARYLKVPARRSQKLSDKITSLQEVVSPYGKTDTASVLQETCMYIKIAHQEIRRLTVSYFGTRPFLHPQLVHGSAEKWIRELRSRGLCLVPLSIINRLGSADDVAESSTIHQGVTTVMDSWRF